MYRSGRWPTHPVAFKKMKAALGLQLSEALEKSYGLLTQVSSAGGGGQGTVPFQALEERLRLANTGEQCGW